MRSTKWEGYRNMDHLSAKNANMVLMGRMEDTMPWRRYAGGIVDVLFYQTAENKENNRTFKRNAATSA